MLKQVDEFARYVNKRNSIKKEFQIKNLIIDYIKEIPRFIINIMCFNNLFEFVKIDHNTTILICVITVIIEISLNVLISIVLHFLVIIKTEKSELERIDKEQTDEFVKAVIDHKIDM